MTGILTAILSVIVLLGAAFLMSNDKKNINYRAVVILFVAQLVTAYAMLNTAIGGQVVKAVTDFFAKLMVFGNEGIAFVFGGFVFENDRPVFFISVLLLIVFTSTLLSVLTYIRILPLMIKYLGGAVSKLTGLPVIESFSTVASSIFGDTGALIAVKNHIPKMNKNRLFIATTASLTSVSASIVGAYMTMIPSEYVLVALPLNIMSGLLLASMVAPAQSVEGEEIRVKDMINDKSLFEAIGNGAIDGMKVAGIVGAMLIAYISLIAMVNFVLTSTIGIDLTTIMGFVLSPVAWLMGVPANEMVQAGGVMGTKIISNEFVAMLGFQEMIPNLSAKTVGVVSAFLISFANFSSIGIIIGTVQAIDEKQSGVVAKFGLKMLLVATMASVLTATVVGLFI
ncbi:nucleoside transporter C-terminal domain-containing protein [Paenisporosarcina sp. FSL H8-0542]|uniref:NupC/NupG family nucleoside CNT transporter n=1 Tax=unclassified Paenisporosarcina TaxID=2642018 RepID=UPI00034E6AE4|nr:nucleoside transporter C-terminal domain-containing protein [Paenisporosarcina sp. HGH0030]EPD50863.1 NupC family nucleoside transporter [Paenisporosarcina sp. HGH0030]